ncbi:dienelactone hydrolase family protein [Nocardioides sp.]|uniref:alpha/beta hydrolase family protein n=1 Tax=Nocardioides sp. TaxID=35761 RepID=UPI002BCCEA8B|nr:dienelactone hydrolase family protein [Nocardioides sp.]HVX53590.1 dienelactone hydrolase family protein [Nocardioides sp.]
MARTSSLTERWRATGRHRVETLDVPAWTVVDGRSVAVFAQFPTEVAEPAPVVVLAHGLGGDHRGYAALGARLAGHGHVVLHPQFLDSFALAASRLGMGPGEEHTWPRDPRHRAAMHEMLFDPTHWMARVARVHAVLDSLATQTHLPVALRPDRVILAGHSYGAYTAQLVLGTRLEGVGIDDSLRHPAACAGLLLSPQGSGDRGLTPRSWDEVATPVLVVTATADRGPHGEGLSWRREPFDAAPAPLKHLAVVQGGDHLLGGIDRRADEAPTDPAVSEAVATLCAAFADLVNGDPAAGRWLRADPFPEIFHHEFREDVA